MTALDKVCELVEKFERGKSRFKQTDYTESDVRSEFVDPLFEALGWDVRDSSQVRREGRVRIQGRIKHPDYSFLVGRDTAFYVETKKPSINLRDSSEAAVQLRAYGWSGNTDVGILTDFEEFVVYDCRVKPKVDDSTNVARVMLITYEHYIEQWEDLVKYFSREAVQAGKHRSILESKPRGIFGVDVAFLHDMEKWRDKLAKDMHLRNHLRLTLRQLNHLVQRTIDRIVFLRIAEDRNLEPYGRLERASQVDEGVYEELKILFKEADDKYNSGLFHFDPKNKERGDADTLSLNLILADAPLRSVISELYPWKSLYQFSVIPTDILGQVYERFLGKVIVLDTDRKLSVEEKPEVRKANGVYYTPTYIVEYIVENTVGKLTAGKTPTDVAKLRVLDPACGSGSFLIGAYQYLMDWHLDYYIERLQDNPNSSFKSRVRDIATDEDDNYVLTIQEKRRILLNNIYGVDLDQNAVEVTKLSLLLKMLEKEHSQTPEQYALMETQILPDLNNNIRWGNSLIGTNFYSDKQMVMFDEEEIYRIKAFDWESRERGFGEIMAQGGFDAVIGNPPWGSKEVLDSEALSYIGNKYRRNIHNMNIFAIFIDECIENLLKKSGLLGFLIPKNFTKTQAYQPYREDILNRHSLNLIVDFGKFPGVAQEAVALFVSAKSFGTNYIQRIYVENKQYFYLDELNVSDVKNAKFRMITLARMPNLSPIVSKINSISFNLGDEFEVGRGLEHGRNGDLIHCPYCANYFERPGKRNRNIKEISCKSCKNLIDISTSQYDYNFVHDSHADVSSIKSNGLLIGTSIDRYLLKEIPYNAILGLPGINYKNLHNMDEKLYFIRIAKSLRGYLDKEGLLALNALNFVYKPNKKAPYKLEYVLGILNSQLLKSYVEFTVTGGANLTIRLSNAIMRSLPIRTIDFDNPTEKEMHGKMVTLVETMLGLHKQLPGLSGIGREMVEAQIERTDTKIDRLVYRLYDLNDDEIAIVEE